MIAVTENLAERTAVVVLCDCHGALRAHLDYDTMQDILANDAAVSEVLLCPDLCGPDALQRCVTAFAGRKMVLAGCRLLEAPSALSHLLDCGAEIAVANIREWAVGSAVPAATERALRQLKLAVQKLLLQEELPEVEWEQCQSVAVIGGGTAAAVAALHLAGAGHQVDLVCNQSDGKQELPDRLRRFMLSFLVQNDYLDAGSIAEEQQLHEKIRNHPGIRTHREMAVTGCRGQVGNFEITLQGNGTCTQLQAGAILASCTDLLDCTSDMAASSPAAAVISISDFAAKLEQNQYLPDRIAIILDAEREQGRLTGLAAFAVAGYALRSGCKRVRIYCRNIRVAGRQLESLYRTVRAAGVEFCKYQSGLRVLASPNGCVIEGDDTQLGTVMRDEFDLVVDARMTLSESGEKLLATLGLTDSRALSSRLHNVWFKPCRSSRPGIFLLGLAGSNLDYHELFTEAGLSAGAIHSLLAERNVKKVNAAAVVDEEKCVACLTCVRLCPHGAMLFDTSREAAAAAVAACQRCGICAAECPAAAIQLPMHTDSQVALEVQSARSLTVFACINSAYEAATRGLYASGSAPENMHMIRVPCAGKVDPRDILRALESGAEHVLVLSCNRESCQFIDGADRAQRRIQRIHTLLQQAGLDPQKVSWGSVTASETAKAVQLLQACLSKQTPELSQQPDNH